MTGIPELRGGDEPAAFMTRSVSDYPGAEDAIAALRDEAEEDDE